MGNYIYKRGHNVRVGLECSEKDKHQISENDLASEDQQNMCRAKLSKVDSSANLTSPRSNLKFKFCHEAISSKKFLDSTASKQICGVSSLGSARYCVPTASYVALTS